MSRKKLFKIRTTFLVSLEAETLDRLRMEARHLGCSVSRLICKAIEVQLDGTKTASAVLAANDEEWPQTDGPTSISAADLSELLMAIQACQDEEQLETFRLDLPAYGLSHKDMRIVGTALTGKLAYLRKAGRMSGSTEPKDRRTWQEKALDDAKATAVAEEAAFRLMAAKRTQGGRKTHAEKQK